MVFQKTSEIEFIKIYNLYKKDLTSQPLIDIILKSLGEVAELVEGAALEML